MKYPFLQFVIFTLFSLSAGIIQIGSFTLFLEVFEWEYWLAYLVSLVLSVVWNFTLNRRYTFKAAVNVTVAMAQLFGFYLVFTPVSTYLGHLAVQTFKADYIEYIVEVLTMLSNFVLEFLFCKFVMFKNHENTLKSKR